MRNGITPREALAVAVAIGAGAPIMVFAMPYVVWVIAVYAALLGGI